MSRARHEAILSQAVVQLGGGHARITEHTTSGWASVSFNGTRHRFTLAFDGDAAKEVGEDFIAALPHHEFIIPGQLVADADIAEVGFTSGRLTVTCEILTVNDR